MRGVPTHPHSDLTRTASAFFIFYGTVLLATYTMVGKWPSLTPDRSHRAYAYQRSSACSPRYSGTSPARPWWPVWPSSTLRSTPGE